MRSRSSCSFSSAIILSNICRVVDLNSSVTREYLISLRCLAVSRESCNAVNGCCLGDGLESNTSMPMSPLDRDLAFESTAFNEPLLLTALIRGLPVADYGLLSFDGFVKLLVIGYACFISIGLIEDFVTLGLLGGRGGVLSLMLLV